MSKENLTQHGPDSTDLDAKDEVRIVDYSNDHKVDPEAASDGDRTKDINEGYDASFVKSTMKKVDWRLIPGGWGG